jgi:hypothetical protein
VQQGLAEHRQLGGRTHRVVVDQARQIEEDAANLELGDRLMADTADQRGNGAAETRLVELGQFLSERDGDLRGLR